MLGKAESGGKEPLLRVVSPEVVDLTGDKLLRRPCFLLGRSVREILGDIEAATSECSAILAEPAMMKLSFSSAVRSIAVSDACSPACPADDNAGTIAVVHSAGSSMVYVMRHE
jgi:hypothetical protein